MSRKEVPRAGLLKAARSGKITNAQGALALHLTIRQFQRLKVRFAAEGARGLLHRLRGRPSPRRIAAAVRQRAAALLQATYAGLNDCHATEKLQEVDSLQPQPQLGAAAAPGPRPAPEAAPAAAPGADTADA